MKRLPLLLLLVALLVGCGPAKSSKPADGHVPPPASEMDPTWIRLVSEHFDLSTDLSEDEARRAVDVLERTRAALLSAAWQKAPDTPAARTAVVVFRDGLEFMQFFEEAAAIFIDYVRPTIVLWGKPDYWEQRTGVSAQASSSLLRHELTHRIASSFFVRQPRWFAEGLAQYFQTLAVADDGTMATVGEVDPEALLRYRGTKAKVQEVLAWKSYEEADPDTIRGYYGVSWLLVHYLVDQRPDEFEAFQNALVRGDAPELAWKKIFGATQTDLDARLAEYARKRSYKSAVVPIARVSVKPITRAKITDADVHAIRAQLALVGAAGPAQAKLRREAAEQLRRSLALEPANPLTVRLLLASGKLAPDDPRLATLLNAQITKRPDDGEGWLLVAEWGARTEREAAARKALALMPESPDACILLAWHLAEAGRADEALPLAKKAAALAPWESRAHHIYAVALHGTGRCSDAIGEATRALEVLPDGPSRGQLAEKIERGLDEIRRECAKAARAH